MRRIVLLIAMAVLGTVMLYLSRFWVFNLWPRSGLFGIEELRPTGGLLAVWLRGTPFAPFELLIWASGVFLTLTYLQKFVDFILPAPAPQDDDQPAP